MRPAYASFATLAFCCICSMTVVWDDYNFDEPCLMWYLQFWHSQSRTHHADSHGPSVGAPFVAHSRCREDCTLIVCVHTCSVDDSHMPVLNQEISSSFPEIAEWQGSEFHGASSVAQGTRMQEWSVGVGALGIGYWICALVGAWKISKTGQHVCFFVRSRYSICSAPRCRLDLDPQTIPCKMG